MQLIFVSFRLFSGPQNDLCCLGCLLFEIQGADRGTGFAAGWEILIGRQDAGRPHRQDGYAPQDSDAGQQHQQLPKRQAEQEEGKNHESDANGLETKPLSDSRN